MNRSTPALLRKQTSPGDAGNLHFPLQGTLSDFTLAAHPQLRTAALLYSLRGEPGMLQEQQFEVDEFALLLRLLNAYPQPIPASAREDVQGPVFAPLDSGGFRHKVGALALEVTVQGGYALRPSAGSPLAPSEVADELYLLAPRRVFPAGTALVANQCLCTVSLITLDPPVGARLLWERPLTPQQMALLITLLNDDLQPVLQREVFAEVAQAALLYGTNWLEREGNVDHALERRYPALPPQEQERAERLVRHVFESLVPVLELLGLGVRNETSYYLFPATCRQDAPG